MVPVNPGQRVAEPQVFVPQVGRAGWEGASPCVCPGTAQQAHITSHPGTGGQNWGLPLLLCGMPVPQMKARSISQIKFAKIFESSEKII